MKIFLVRHGQSEGNINKAKYFEKNDCDIELTEQGKADAVKAADTIYSIIHSIHNLKYDNPQLVFSEDYKFNLVHSTYKRATQTANILCDRLQDNGGYTIQSMSSSPLCREREWGSLRDIIESKMKTEEHFNFYYRPLNGESFADAYQRAVIFHQHLVNTTRYENNIVVAHGEFNKVYLMYLLGWDIQEFEKWANQKNGEVWLINNNKLSSATPLLPNKHKRK